MSAKAARRGAPPRVYSFVRLFIIIRFKMQEVLHMIRINGKEEAAQGMLLKDYLEQNGYPAGGIAVECNERIVAKQDYESYVIRDGDVIEVVSFVGGG